MSKRSRHADNSKRQQPMQQQRAQARMPGLGGPTKPDHAGQQQPREGKSDGGSNKTKR